jgi:hypothetical protein
MDLGPANVLMDLRVGVYLNNSPTAAEIDCLKSFFRAVRTTTQTVPSRSIGGQQLIERCNHVLQIAQQGNKVFVTDIFRGCLPP